jgi:site-specific DNA-adenine methylase
MVYQGSKNRLAKDLVPIIQSYVDSPNCVGYLEPFVGGANLIDKIVHPNKFGSDIHPYLIALLKQTQSDSSIIPLHISEEEYLSVRDNKDNYEPWYVGLVGFCATYGSRYFEGYARGFKSDGITPRDIPNERINNLIKQAPDLKGVNFNCLNYKDVNSDIHNFVIYCDPPYRNTKKYNVEQFNYEEFYKWCIQMAKNNIVLVSEYNMPEDKFECIWSKKTKTMLDSLKDEGYERVEKLFKVRGGIYE